MKIYDATTHPQPSDPVFPVLDVVRAPRLELVGDATILGVWPQVGGNPIKSFWPTGRTGEFDMDALNAWLSLVPTESIVSLNVESAPYNPHRYKLAGDRFTMAAVDKYLALQSAFIAAAKASGHRVASPFEAFHESTALTIEIERVANLGVANHVVYGQYETVVRRNNDALQALFDASNYILVRLYVSDSTITPAQVKSIAWANIDEGRSLARWGQPLIGITKPETMTVAQMSALVSVAVDEGINLAIWAEPDVSFRNQAKARQLTSMITDKVRQHVEPGPAAAQ